MPSLKSGIPTASSKYTSPPSVKMSLDKRAHSIPSRNAQVSPKPGEQPSSPLEDDDDPPPLRPPPPPPGSASMEEYSENANEQEQLEQENKSRLQLDEDLGQENSSSVSATDEDDTGRPSISNENNILLDPEVLNDQVIQVLVLTVMATLVKYTTNESEVRILYEYLAEASVVFPKVIKGQ